jgi:hypothetical protein
MHHFIDKTKYNRPKKAILRPGEPFSRLPSFVTFYPQDKSSKAYPMYGRVIEWIEPHYCNNELYRITVGLGDYVTPIPGRPKSTVIEIFGFLNSVEVHNEAKSVDDIDMSMLVDRAL